MEQERIGFLLGNNEQREDFFNTHVHFKGKFFKPKGGYKMTKDDKKNTEYCFNKLVNQLRYG